MLSRRRGRSTDHAFHDDGRLDGVVGMGKCAQEPMTTSHAWPAQIEKLKKYGSGKRTAIWHTFGEQLSRPSVSPNFCGSKTCPVLGSCTRKTPLLGS